MTFLESKLSSRTTAVFTALIAFTVYLLTMPPGLTWQHFGVDGGELITASYTWGVAHPPGYPLYVVLGKLFSYLPLGNIAYRYNLFSGVCMSAAVGLTAAVWYQRVAKDRWLWGVIGGTTLAFGTLVWQQAIIAEVYALYLFFCAAALYLVSGPPSTLLESTNEQNKGQGEPERLKVTAVKIGIVWGLTICSHPTGGFLAPILLFHLHRRLWPHFFGGTLVGLTPLLLLPVLANSGSPIVWGDPTSFGGWYSLVTAQIYRQDGLTLSWETVLDRLVSWGPIWLSQMTFVGFPLVIWSGWQKKKAIKEWGVWFATALLFILFALLYGPGDAIVMSMPAFLILCILLIDGLTAVGKWAVCLPLGLLLLNFNIVNISQDRTVHQQVDHLLREVPRNAILETSGDPILFALWYVNYVDDQRLDVDIVDNELFAFFWYRQQVGQQIEASQAFETDNITRFRQIMTQQRPYCLVELTDDNSMYRLSCS